MRVRRLATIQLLREPSRAVSGSGAALRKLFLLVTIACTVPLSADPLLGQEPSIYDTMEYLGGMDGISRVIEDSPVGSANYNIHFWPIGGGRFRVIQYRDAGDGGSSAMIHIRFQYVEVDGCPEDLPVNDPPESRETDCSLGVETFMGANLLVVRCRQCVEVVSVRDRLRTLYSDTPEDMPSVSEHEFDGYDGPDTVALPIPLTRGVYRALVHAFRLLQADPNFQCQDTQDTFGC